MPIIARLLRNQRTAKQLQAAGYQLKQRDWAYVSEDKPDLVMLEFWERGNELHIRVDHDATRALHGEEEFEGEDYDEDEPLEPLTMLRVGEDVRREMERLARRFQTKPEVVMTEILEHFRDKSKDDIYGPEVTIKQFVRRIVEGKQ
jgi:hypothetical protein